ncbi:MAG: hypothetical protein ACRBDI_10530 [Alphaproteobacteria bacterium]
MADGFEAMRKRISTWLNKLSAFVYSDAGDALSAIPSNTAPLLSDEITPEDCGSAILDAGWRQGSFVDVSAFELPDKFPDVSNVPYVMVCSQSCTAVSRSFVRDPYVELIVARPVQQYNPRSDAARGKTPRTLHLKVAEGNDFPALELSINDRFEVPRAALLHSAPLSEISLQEGEPTKLTNWLGRNYTRLAMPDALVEGLREHFFKGFEKFLKIILEDGQRLNCYLDNIYISWQPDGEHDDYTVKMIMIADNEEVQIKFEEDYLPQIEKLMADNECGFKFTVMSCMLRDELFLSDLDGYKRFSHYDYFTSMEEWQQLSILRE